MFAVSRPAPAWLAGALLAAGCATNTAPPGFLPSPDEAQTEAYGGWIELRSAAGGRNDRVDGELMAVTEDSVWVLGDSGAVVLPTAAVREGKLTAYRSGTGAVAGWTFLGVLSTVSNGVFLLGTAPLWIITGTVAGTRQSHIPERDVAPRAWSQLAPFARFPHGMPAGVRLEDLRKHERAPKKRQPARPPQG